MQTFKQNILLRISQVVQEILVAVDPSAKRV